MNYLRNCVFSFFFSSSLWAQSSPSDSVTFLNEQSELTQTNEIREDLERDSLEIPNEINEEIPNIWIYPHYIYIGMNEGRGISYKRGYLSLGVFTAPSTWTISRFQPFADVKGYCFNDGKFAANVGIGFRYFFSSICLGANVYYDYRRVHRKDFNQIGLGFEVLSSLLDFRLNGYLPVGNINHMEAKLYDFGDDFLAIRRRRVSAWKGVDAEFGTWIKKKYPSNWFGLYVAMGPYYYMRKHSSHFGGKKHQTWGGRARLLARINDFVDISVNATYDSIWRTRVQGQITVAIPFDVLFNLRSRRPVSSLCDQLTIQPVHRNGIIVADEECCWLWNWSDGGDSGDPTSYSIDLSSIDSFWHSFPNCPSGNCQ